MEVSAFFIIFVPITKIMNNMKIDFNKIEKTIVPNFKGGEGRYIMKQFADDKVKIMLGKLEPGCSIGLHTHEMNCEIMYILSGQASYVYEGQEEIVNPGEVHYNPMNKQHTLLNRGSEDLVFFAVVAEHH